MKNNDRKTWFVTRLAGITLIILTLSSCPNGLFGNGGSIVLNIESDLEEIAGATHDNAKGIIEVPLKIASWVISGDGPEDESFSTTIEDDSTTSVRQDGLVAGSWTITAAGKNDDGTNIVNGGTTVLVEKGSITYAGIVCDGAGGTGSLAIHIEWPAASIREPDIHAYVSYSDLLSPSREMNLPITMAETSASGTLAGIPGGPIALEIVIQDSFGEGKLVWSDLEIVHIVADETINGTWTLQPNEINSIGEGDVDINVVANIPQPIDVSLVLTATASSDTGNIFTVTGTAIPGVDEYFFYCDGVSIAEGLDSNLVRDIGPGLSPGPHFITLACRQGMNYGSATLKVVQLDTGIGKGTVVAWGYAAQLGQRGEGDWGDSPVPVQVQGLSRGIPLLVDAGAYHAMAVAANGELWTWGMNDGYQCGHSSGQYTVWNPGRPIPELTVTAIAAGWWQSLAQTEAYGLFAWGRNEFGQLGCGDTINRASAVYVEGAVKGLKGNDIIDISAGWYHSLALGKDGTAYSWGSNEKGELGDGTLVSRLTSVKVTAPAGVAFADIETGGHSSFGVTSDGAVYGWGYNSHRLISDTATASYLIPTKIPLSASRDFTDIAILGEYGYAVASDGTVWKWGGNSGWITQISSPDGTTILEVDGMEATILGRGANGKLYTLGDNSFNALGDGISGLHGAQKWTLVQGLSGKNIEGISMGCFGGMAVIAW
ncbi:MAG TPA: hypothetical protein VN445_13890 [Rectinemataceae bacterium]|nr:hypothetical protein [Rectinemataceae bacterium]